MAAQDLITIPEFKILFPEDTIRSALIATVDVSGGAIGDVVIVNGTTYTMAAAESVADREWSTAAELVSALNSVDYGVSGIFASDSGDVVTIVAANQKFVPQVFNKSGALVLATDYDETLQEQITAASGMISKVLLGGRQLVDDTETPIVENTEASGAHSYRLLLTTWPITSVASIREDSDLEFDEDTELDTDDYSVDLEKGFILKKTGFWSEDENSIRVTYQGGYPADAIPQHFKIACGLQAIWNMDNARAQTVTRAREETVEVFRAASGVLKGVSPLVMNILDAEARE